MVQPLNDTLNGPKCDENGSLSLHNSLWTIRLFHHKKRRKQKPKVEETEAQSGRNGTKMVQPLNDALNGPKCDENGALSLHNSLWTIRLFHRTKRRKRKPKEEETESKRGGRKRAE